MKIITRSITRMSDMQTIHEESYEYDGPVAGCISFGKGASGGGGGGTQPSETQERVVGEFFDITKPATEAFTSQILELLSTGGVGAQLPIIAQATERSRSAASKALSSTEDELARVGLTGTPFGQRTLAETRMSGQQSTADVGTQILMSLLQQIPGFLTGSSAAILQGSTGLATTAPTAGTKGGFDVGLFS